MAKIDLIVTHYDEPWEKGCKFFDMLALQRGINFQDISVLIIQDGDEGTLPWHTLLDGYPYEIRIMTVKHGGVSAARNAGITTQGAEWIMFCDFDDTFSSTYSVRRYLESIHDELDLISGDLYNEVENGNGGYILDRYGDNNVYIHGKLFRRAFLIDNGVRFVPEVTFSEDSLFCKTMRIPLNPARTHHINEILYVRCFYGDSITKSDGRNFENAQGLFLGRIALIREYLDRGCPRNHAGMVVKTAFDFYYAITSGTYPDPPYFTQLFREFWEKYKDTFTNADYHLIAYENGEAFHEAVNKGLATVPPVTFWDWVKEVTAE